MYFCKYILDSNYIQVYKFPMNSVIAKQTIDCRHFNMEGWSRVRV